MQRHQACRFQEERFEKGSRIVRASGSRFPKGKTSGGWGLFLEIIKSGLWPHVTKVHEDGSHWE